jgi:hypothetical protein
VLAAIDASTASTNPDIGVGEIWIKADGEWKMVGASTHFSYVTDTSGLSSQSMLTSQIVTDLDGQSMLIEAIMDGKDRRIAFGIADGEHVESDAILVTFEEHASRGDRVLMMVEFVLRGAH